MSPEAVVEGCGGREYLRNPGYSGIVVLAREFLLSRWVPLPPNRKV